MNHVLIMDNLITNQECDDLIKFLNENSTGSHGPPFNYEFCDIENNIITEKIVKNLVNNYVNVFPEINLTKDRWNIFSYRIKKFNPGKYYDDWHSEHTKKYSNRIACIILYLSTHNCGTEFYTKETIMSVKGRGMIFPSSWTHTHQGQPCPENKPRYILSAYIDFI